MSNEVNQALVAKPTLFNENLLIKSMSHDENWTVSSEQKQPIDMRTYINTGDIVLARINDEWNPLVSLNDINKHPEFAYTNRAYRMKASKDKIICIDIENTASEETKQYLMQFPFDYLEYSTHMGIHGLMRIDKDLITPTINAILASATTIRHPSKTWEMFFNKHYCTFTQNVIATIPFDDETRKSKMKEFLDYITKIYNDKESTRTAKIEANKLKREIPKEIENIASIFPKNDFKYIKKLTPEDFVEDNGEVDMSKYEYNILLYIRKQLSNRILYGFDDPFYTLKLPKPINKLTQEDYAYLTFYFGQKIIPHRDKHDTDRDGLPFMLYMAKSVANLSDSQYKSVKKSAKYGPTILDKKAYERFFLNK